MKQMRVQAILLILALVLASLVGCGGGQDSGASDSAPVSESTLAGETAETQAAPEAQASAEPVTLTLLQSNTSNTAGTEAVFAKMEQDIGIRVERELRPGGAEGENIVRARLASGDSTDLHEFSAGSLFATLNPEQYFLGINDQPFMDRMLDSYIESVTFGGVTYGIPANSSMAGAWLYNKAIYAELGLEVPHTWEALMENCEAIKAAGKTAVIASFGTDWTSQLILLADFYNVHSNDPNFAGNFDTNQDKYSTNPYAFKAFEHMEEVWNRGFYNADYNATTYDQALKMLADGEGAHYPILTQAVSNIALNYGEEAAEGIGAFGQPGDDPANHGLTVWMPDTFYFFKDSEHIDDMMRMAEYFLREESVKLFAEAQGADGPFVLKDASLPENTYAPIKDLIPYFDEGKTAPAMEYITSVKGPNAPQICIQCMGGMKPAKECAEEYDKDVEKQAKQLGLEGW